MKCVCDVEKKYEIKNRKVKERKHRNKARYTATSCERVGMGGYARFPTFRLDHYGPTDGRTDGRTDGQSLL